MLFSFSIFPPFLYYAHVTVAHIPRNFFRGYLFISRRFRNALKALIDPSVCSNNIRLPSLNSRIYITRNPRYTMNPRDCIPNQTLLCKPALTRYTYDKDPTSPLHHFAISFSSNVSS